MITHLTGVFGIMMVNYIFIENYNKHGKVMWNLTKMIVKVIL